MKTTLKTLIVALVCALSVSTAAWADKDRPIEVSQLPAAAQQLIKKHFAGKKVALSKLETGVFEKSYDVIFTNGDKIEFDRQGNWTEISCKKSAVPAALVPQAIRTYVQQHYSGARVVSIEKDRSEYEVKLSTRLELTFNSRFQLIDIDD